MDTSIHHFTQTEGGGPSMKPTLIARSPYKRHGDIERDMERNNVKKAPLSAPPTLHAKSSKSLNPRGPHYSGTYSQHSSSTSSSHTSLSNSSSEYGHYSEQYYQDPQRERRNPRRPVDHGYYQQPQYSGTRHSGLTRQQHPTAQYSLDKSSYDNYVPTGYYQSYDDHQQQKREYDYQPSVYRHSSRQHGPLIKAYSEETFREVGQHGSEKGFSSLGDVPNRISYQRQELPLRQPLMSHYKYQTEYPKQYRAQSPSSTQYSYNSGSNFSSDMNGTDILSEQIERMKVVPGSDIEILKQPLDQVVNLNERVVFICNARVIHCKEDPNILWFKNREPLIGEIDSTYVIDETTETDAGMYHCLITHPLDTSIQKESYSATLTVNNKASTSTPSLASLPEVIEQPFGTVKAIVGDPLELVIRARGEEPLSYQWYRNSQPMNFAQSCILRFPVAAITDGGMYCCRVANGHGSILSKSFTLEVTRVKVVPTDLSDSYLSRVGSIIAQQVRSVDELAVSFGIKMSQRTVYRSLEEQLVHLLKIWRDTKNGSKQKLVGILQQHHLVLQDSLRNPQYVQPKKEAAKLHILRQPQSSRVIYGQPVSLQVSIATVIPSIKYQWYLNGKALVGQTLSCLNISSAVDSDVGEYVCVISSNEARMQSEPAIVELTDTPHRRVTPESQSQAAAFEPPKRYLIERGVPTNRGANVRFEPPTNRRANVESEPKLPSLAQSNMKEVPSTIVIEEHPTSVEIEPGDPLTLRCRATNTQGELKYSWYFNGLLIEEEQSDYVLNCFTDEDEGYYNCKVSNGYTSVTSNIAQVKAKLDSD